MTNKVYYNITSEVLNLITIHTMSYIIYIIPTLFLREVVNLHRYVVNNIILIK